MYKQFFLALLVITSASRYAFASEIVFSCKEDYISDYNEHIFTATTLKNDKNGYRLTIVDHYQLMDFYNNLFLMQNDSLSRLEVLFSQCNFSKELEWEVSCNQPISATFYDRSNEAIVSTTNLDITNGRFSTEEENKNWFFSSLGLSVNNKFAEMKAQYHPEDNCSTK
jgi:hypothetical protein